MKNTIALLLLFLLSTSIFAQNQADSLLVVLATKKQDTSFVNLSNQLVKQLTETQTDKAIEIAQKGVEVAQKLDYQQGIAQLKIGLGWVYYRKGYIEKAFAISQEALQLIEKIGDNSLKAAVLINIGAIYNEQERYELSLDYFEKALAIEKSQKNYKSMGRCLNNLAFTAFKAKNYKLAQNYIEKSIAHNQEHKNEYFTAFALRTQGDIWLEEQKSKEALAAWLKAAELGEKVQNNPFLISCLHRIAKAYIEQKDYILTQKYLDYAAQIAQKAQLRTEFRQIYQLQSACYEGQKKYAEALAYHKKYVELNDSIFRENNTKKLSQLQANFESERKEQEISLLKAQKVQNQLLHEKESQQQQWIIFSVLAALFSLLVISFLILKSQKNIKKAYAKLENANTKILEKNEEIQQQNEEINQQKEEILQTLEITEMQRLEIQKKNNDVTASITYALRIQNAIIPKETDLKELDCFVFSRPRDIVSGDFYFFFDKVTIKILGVADCTGHGVSGAFMTMIGNNILNKIIQDYEEYEPDQILNLMPNLLAKILSSSDSKIKDGMDISILTFYQKDKNIKKVAYAGAMNPLYYVQNNELKEIKADKRPIEGVNNNFVYQKHEIDLPQNNTTIFYLFSDGFQDQFGGKDDKKFMTKNFKKLLLEVSEKNMNEQKQVLAHTFDTWKNRQKQTDDVLVLGVRV